jgi:hypothetical protein
MVEKAGIDVLIAPSFDHNDFLSHGISGLLIRELRTAMPKKVWTILEKRTDRAMGASIKRSRWSGERS